MKAHELAEFVLAEYVRNPKGQMQGALLEGVAKLFIENTERLNAAHGPGKLSVLREMFTFWKAAVNKIVCDPRWPDHPVGYRTRAMALGISAFPVALERHDPQNFLDLLARNVFLGWKPDDEMKRRIAAHQWHQPLVGRKPAFHGLSINHHLRR